MKVFICFYFNYFYLPLADHVSNPSPSQSAREKDHDGEMSISGEPKSRASYRLIGVITHQGASADSGHYCSYVRSSKVEDKWLFFNDDKVSEVGEEVIGTLSGGGKFPIMRPSHTLI